MTTNPFSKYLHFDGESETSGFPGCSFCWSLALWTALNFTAANDDSRRDPVVFEIYGATESIEGPYTLIAVGTVDDFNDVNEWAT